MSDLEIFIKTLVGFGLAYWVYTDCKKKNVKYASAWIIGTFIFYPIAIGYYLYSKLGSKNVELSRKQRWEMEIRKRTEQKRKEIKEERDSFELLKEEETAKNQLAIEEMEKVKAERLALKEKRLRELEEERQLQREEIEKKMKMHTEMANKIKVEE